MEPEREIPPFPLPSGVVATPKLASPREPKILTGPAFVTNALPIVFMLKVVAGLPIGVAVLMPEPKPVPPILPLPTPPAPLPSARDIAFAVRIVAAPIPPLPPRPSEDCNEIALVTPVVGC